MNRYRPELHVTAEVGVLEAPAGALGRGDSLHVFHQFRPRPDAGARWAHQVASSIPYGWDVCDDVLVPRDDEIDCLAGSAVPLGDGVELFFVTTTPVGDVDPSDLRSNALPHGHRGERSFSVQRARIADLGSAVAEVSDDPSVVSPFVERLGPVDIDDSAHPVHDLATPSVVRRGEEWIMVALDLVDDVDARIVVLESADRQSWTVRGALEFTGESVPRGRPYAPRLTRMTDLGTGEEQDVLFITFPDDGSAGDSHAGDDATSPRDRETTGYIVGQLEGSTFRTSTSFQLLDHGHDFTRPRLVHGSRPVLSGLVGAYPHSDSADEPATWANCLSVPRFLSLRDGHLYQDVIGLPTAVRSYTDRAAVYTAQLDVETGTATVDLLDRDGGVLVSVAHSGGEVSVTRDGDTRVAPLTDGDSDTLTIFVDGPVCEVFADGGLVSLTTALTGPRAFDRFSVRATGGARVLSAMESLGRQLQRQLAHLDDPAEQEKLIREAVLADRDLAAGIDPGE
ncbi:GH32 C-terminal domain-containing protein [Corynebacteriaceae bacterium 7-707]